MPHWIMHIDMDAFFAAVEQRDNPNFKDKPVIVGGLGSRGVVSTASYEARRFGVKSAMAMTEARRRCPQGIYLAGNHTRYRTVSKQIHQILNDFSPIIEPLSLDEAFLDMSGMEYLFPDIKDAARQLKDRIRRELGLVASVGAAPNKFLAKLASDLKKPDGLFIIRPGEEKSILADLPVSRLWGVGEVTANILHKLGITTIGQVAQADVAELQAHCGNIAVELYLLAQGKDDRPVVANYDPKSVGHETTFEIDIRSADAICGHLLLLAEKVGWRLRKMGVSGRTITLKVRFASFRTITRSKTITDPTHYDEEIYAAAKELWRKCIVNEGVRLLGITVSGLTSGLKQTSLFAPSGEKKLAVYEAVDRLRDKFGARIVTKGRLVTLSENNGEY